MRIAHRQSTLLAAAMAAVFVLPYTAPIVCRVLGRMGGEMEMTADAAAATIQAPGSGGLCCTLNECGLPQVAPVAFALDVEQRVATVWGEFPALTSAHATSALVPRTPPPQV